MSALGYATYMGLDLGPYTGQWIAIVGKEVVAHGKDAKKIYDEAKKVADGKPIFVTVVPEKGAMIL